MNSIAWYSRLVIWTTAALLSVEAVAGRSFGLLTALAVVGLIVALPAFSLALAGVPARLRPLEPAGTAPETLLPPVASESTGLLHAVPALPPRTHDATPDQSVSVERTQSPEAPAPPSATVEPAVAPTPPAAPRSRVPHVGVATITAGSDLRTAACPRCLLRAEEGQVVAICPACGATHHVGCWVENRFHCAREGCEGHGSLEEPGA